MKSERSPQKLLAGFGLALLGLAAFYFIGSVQFTFWDFRNNLWGPGYLLIHGYSPYRLDLLFENSRAVWFPHIIGLLYPIGFLSQWQAGNLWFLLNLGAIVALVYSILNQHGTPRPALFGLVCAGIFLFPPTVNLLRLGQVDVLLVALWLASLPRAEKSPLLAAFCLALWLTKPQMGILLFPALAVQWGLENKSRLGLKILLLSAAICAWLTLPLWFHSPGWPMDFMESLSANPQWAQPTLRARLGEYPGGAALYPLLVVACLGAGIATWRRMGQPQATYWLMALTPLALPYGWTWDFTLMLPLLVDTAARLARRRSQLTLMAVWALNLAAYIAIRMVNDGEQQFWWMPAWMLLGILASLGLEKWPARQVKQPAG